MNIHDCFYLGKITKTFGYKGELVVFLDTDSPENYEKLESVLIEIKGELIPFFIESLWLQKVQHVVVRFKDISGIEDAQRLVNHNLYLPLSMLPPMKGTKFYYHEITGFEVFDKKYGLLGTVSGVLDYSHQAVLQVMKDRSEILIPITDNIIKSINRNLRKIEVDTPPGLVDIYLNEQES